MNLNNAIIKSENGFIFGGFTLQSWYNEGYKNCYKSDSNAFLFSLTNLKNIPLKMIYIEPSNAIGTGRTYGPVFGNEGSLVIFDESNKNKDSYSDLGKSYQHPEYDYKSNEAESFLAGSKNFQVSEIEVFSYKSKLK